MTPATLILITSEEGPVAFGWRLSSPDTTSWTRRFRPHRTHQNGLSVDIFMPVRDKASQRVSMPTAPWNKFGYSLEFDASGRGEGLTIDFESVAQLLVECDRQARRNGLALHRIIMAPEYVDRVLSAKVAGIQSLSRLFMRTPAWVRHDEHLYLDFRLVASGKSP